ncbi:efflux RND transporter permease subunit [Chitinophaga sp. G-6-1-13]|uniref:Efflux RND transporter permease subunit n=1 Tax=Chitinophaga fulva TaxID=2728842 RepID=A0A848GVY9_9BACT|nr:efflux RND transporter permease subunit [Chitinophaga fulva]NML40860.1 efflux RND transporter permease subunit [Chitinophaga fulva]
MFRKFIERPVLATVISILLVLLGILGLVTLPMSQFPDIAPPSVAVTASYPGANSEVVARSVATPIEEAVNGVENMTYMTSQSNNDGSMTLNVYFRLGTDPDLAAVNVQNRVAKATSQLPAEVIQAGISTQKVQNSMIMVVNLQSDKPEYNETFLQNYAKINIIPEIQRVKGVGQAMVFGAKDYSMRIWLRPDRLTAYNMSPQEVLGAIRDQNLEAAPGRFGEGSQESFEYIIKYKGKLNKDQQYEDIILRANADGSVLRLKDVARVEFGSFTYGSDTRVNGKYGIGIAINQTAGSNANEIQETINKLMKKAEKSFPTGIEYFNIYSTKEYLDESIDQVKHTLVEAFILVFIVVFIFLQDFRSTLIPAIAVPVAIIGTFFFMKLFGFSINLLTLFALILAIGIVVDDAIVVVEAVHAKMEKGANPRIATLSSMQEISGAIISITLVMSAVFIPVGFMEGPAGVFYRQFAFTLAIAILISALNALTLSPALCALILKNNHGGHGEELGKLNGHAKQQQSFGKRFFAAFNTGFNAMTEKYARSLQFLIKRKWLTIAGLLIIGGVTFWMMRKTPTGFIPTEDQGFAVFVVNMPPGSSLERTRQVVDKVEHVVKDLESTHAYLSVSGFNFLSNSSSATSGVGFIKLKPHAERGKIKDMNAIMGMLQGKFAAIPEANIFAINMPTVPGFSNVAGFEMVLQDRTGSGSLEKLGGTAYGFIGELMKRKEIAFAFTTFNNGHPQYEIEIDDRKAKQLGIPVSDILQTMQVYYGSMFASDFNRFGKYYRVIVQADAELRKDPSSLDGVYVKNQFGEQVPINTVVSLKRVYGPETVTRNNLFNAVTINGQAKPGYGSGDAIRAVEEVAAQYLPRGYTYEWVGMTKEEISAGNQSTIIFTLCLIFVYFLLAAQYESYILPLAVILSIPLGIFGVFAFINLFGIDNNIYVQVGLIMLIGLLAKNAILIVEYAVQRRRSGMGLVASGIRAARLRLRPILMTSFAFIAGLLPLMRATGSSALGNRSISTGAAGGMLTGVVLGVFAIPVLYVIFQFLQEKISRKPIVTEQEKKEEMAELVH